MRLSALARDFHGLEPDVADLLWCAVAPPLADVVADTPGRRVGLNASFLSVEIDRGSFEPTSLTECLSRGRDQRLGARFEALVGYWLELQPECRVLARNIQVFEEARTIGELDFLLAINGQTVHVEVAFKYYLGLEVEEVQHWVGPSLRDRLHWKMDKLVGKQMPLGLASEKLDCLRISGIPKPTRSEAIIKGHCFVSAAAETEGDEWTWGTFEQLRFDDSCRWEVLEKPNWFSGTHHIARNTGTNRQLRTRVEKLWASRRRPLLIVRRDKQTLEEESRHFLVPDEWESEARDWIIQKP